MGRITFERVSSFYKNKTKYFERELVVVRKKKLNNWFFYFHDFFFLKKLFWCHLIYF